MRHLFTFRYLLAIVLTTAIGAPSVMAQGDVIVNQLKSTEFTLGAKLTVEDNAYATGSQIATEPGSPAVTRNRLLWTFTPSKEDHLKPGEYKLLLDVRYWKATDSPKGEPSEGFLREIKVVIDSTNIAIGQGAYLFSGAKRFEATIKGLRLGNEPVPIGAVDHRIVGEIAFVPPDEQLDCSTGANLGRVRYGDSGRSDDNFLTVVVGSVAGADEYDLEYGFFDLSSQEADYFRDPESTRPSSEQYVDDLLRHNTTRLTSSHNEFRIFGHFRRGYLLFRYRAVERTDDGGRRYTPWSSDGKTMREHIQISRDRDDRYNAFYVAWQSSVNWQATNNFAEEAKQLPSVTYLDGVLRARQSRTVQFLRNDPVPNIDNEYVIQQQTLYDALGRPAGSVLPTPIYRAATRFIHPSALVQSTMSKGEDGTVYDRSQLETATDCRPPAMTTAAGAGQFYSAANPRRDDNEYVPDGEGYPFSVVRYTPDNTGRVLRSGGVGPTLATGTGHDTRYYYGKPEQDELDRLFGVNAGYAQHYEKNLVVDPNGQASVSILDGKGRTVATALAGLNPENLRPLEGQAEAVRTVRADMLNNELTESGRTSTYSLLIGEASTVDMCYALTEATYATDCCAATPELECHDCAYDVTVVVTSVDACVETSPPGPNGPVLYEESRLGLSFGDLDDCFNSESGMAWQLDLPVGQYRVTKTLRVNQKKLNEEVGRYLASDCVEAEAPFVAEYVATADYDGCAVCDCYNVDYSATSDSICIAACAYTSPCTVAKRQMEADLRPGGQYAKIPAAGVSVNYKSYFFTFSGGPRFQQFAWTDEFVEIDGYPVSPREMTVEQFVANFDDSWLPLLMDWHPERCLLDFCTDELEGPQATIAGDGVTANQYEVLLRRAPSLAEAQSRGLLATIRYDWDYSNNSATRNFLAAIVDRDPYFNAGYGSNGSRPRDFIDLLMRRNWGSETARLSIVEIAVSTLAPMDVSIPNFNFRTAPTYQKDYVWRVLRDQYLSRREYFIHQTRRAYCSDRNNFTSNNYAYHGQDWKCLKQEVCDELPCHSGGGDCIPDVQRFSARFPDLALIKGIERPDDFNEGSGRTLLESLTRLHDRLNQQSASSGEFVPPNSYMSTLTIPYDQFVYWLISNADFLQDRIDLLKSCCTDISIIAEPLKGGALETATAGAIPVFNGPTYCFTTTVADRNQIEVGDLQLLLDMVYTYRNDPGQFRRLLPYYDDVFPLPIPAEFNTRDGLCKTRAEIQTIYNAWLDTGGGGPEKLEESNQAALARSFAAYANAGCGWALTDQDYQYFLQAGSTECLLCPKPIGPPLDVSTDACTEQVEAEARDLGQTVYETYLDDQESTFRRDYLAHCLNTPDEKLLHLREQRQYHYTLYYYDQAGNLTMTVPPDGVRFTDADSLDDVATFRDAIRRSRPNARTPATRPPHELLTHYRYNSFNEVVNSDGPDKQPARSWYDPLGRVVLSQDGRQVAGAGNLFSYTRYDDLGRVFEVGELRLSRGAPTPAVAIAEVSTIGGIDRILEDFTESRFDVTQTYYTEHPFNLPENVYEDNALTLRNRVAATTFTNRLFPRSNRRAYNFGTHYAYDIAGNVKRIVQEFRELAGTGHDYKTLDYDYDLISGNVHALQYQRGQEDQFAYRYEYDRTNRLVAAYSSEVTPTNSNANIWKRDAAYRYYDHGPLKRSIIGQDRLQGVDYAYTLQGWIKGVNGGKGSKDATDQSISSWVMGKDGNDPGTLPEDDVAYSTISRDLYRYQNDYFVGDYSPIGGSSVNPFGEDLPASLQLFNGNIAQHRKIMTTDFFAKSALQAQYDQLNRLVSADDRTKWTPDPRQIGAGNSQTNLIRPGYRYDGNGNILGLTRKVERWETNGLQTAENALSYAYQTGTNRLTSVTPTVSGNLPAAARPFTFLNEASTYQYDGSGNLIANQEGTNESTLSWNAYGKVKRVNRMGTDARATLFGYGPDQNRWVKTKRVTPPGTQDVSLDAEYQVRDAQGNTLAVYRRHTDLVKVNQPPPFPEQPDGPDFPGPVDGPLPGGDIPGGGFPFSGLPIKGTSQAFVGPTNDYRTIHGPMIWRQQYLYGSARLGTALMNRELSPICRIDCDGIVADDEDIKEGSFRPIPPTPAEFGIRQYELTNHLGNVMTVFGEDLVTSTEVSDPGGSTSTFRHPRIIAQHDYLPFGLSYQRSSDPVGDGGSRYGFNGKEKDDDGEWGSSTVYDYGFRVYDPGVARFLSVDPLAPNYAMLTPYQFASNSPVVAIDLDGLEAMITHDMVSRDVGINAIKNPTERELFRDEYRELMGTYAAAAVGGFGIAFAAEAASVWVMRNPALTLQRIREFGTIAYEGLTEQQVLSATALSAKAADELIDLAPGYSNWFQKLFFGQRTGTAMLPEIADGKLRFGDVLANGTGDFVINADGHLIIGDGHHYMSGQAESVIAAGEILIEDGVIKTINNQSGHYQPSEESLSKFLDYFSELGVDVSKATTTTEPLK